MRAAHPSTGASLAPMFTACEVCLSPSHQGWREQGADPTRRSWLISTCGQNWGGGSMKSEHWLGMERWKRWEGVADCELKNRDSRSWRIRTEWVRREERSRDEKQKRCFFWIPKVLPASGSISMRRPDHFPDKLTGVRFGYPKVSWVRFPLLTGVGGLKSGKKDLCWGCYRPRKHVQRPQQKSLPWSDGHWICRMKQWLGTTRDIKTW